MRFDIVVLTLLFAAEAKAREVDWPRELAFDAALGAATLGVAAIAADSNGVERGKFPTQRADDKVHQTLHGDDTGPAPTPKEKRWRQASDVSVIGISVAPAAIALIDDSPETAGKVLTVAHTLLLENFIVTGIKTSVRRPRPKPNAYPSVPAKGDDTLSFPSGHSSAAFAGATLFARLFPEASLAAKLGAFGVAGMTALARIEGDKHFFTDTAVGALIGAGTALGVTAWHRDDGAAVALLVVENGLGVTLAL